MNVDYCCPFNWEAISKSRQTAVEGRASGAERRSRSKRLDVNGGCREGEYKPWAARGCAGGVVGSERAVMKRMVVLSLADEGEE